MSPERVKYHAYLENLAGKAVIHGVIKEIEDWATAAFSDEDGHVRVFMAASTCHRDLVRPPKVTVRSALFTPEETDLPAIRRFLKTANTG